MFFSFESNSPLRQYYKSICIIYWKLKWLTILNCLYFLNSLHILAKLKQKLHSLNRNNTYSYVFLKIGSETTIFQEFSWLQVCHMQNLQSFRLLCNSELVAQLPEVHISSIPNSIIIIRNVLCSGHSAYNSIYMIFIIMNRLHKFHFTHLKGFIIIFTLLTIKLLT